MNIQFEDHPTDPDKVILRKPEYVAFMDVPYRPWVGLTEEEMKKTWYEMQNIMGWYSFQEIAKAVEAKLKEKNT